MKDSIDFISIGGAYKRFLSAGISGLVLFGGQTQAADYVAASGQLAPNPNQAGDSISITGSVGNYGAYDNAGFITMADGTHLGNSGGLFRNRQGGSFKATGVQVLPNIGGGTVTQFSTVDNQSTWANTDTGSTYANLNGAMLNNGGYSVFGPPTPSTAEFDNQAGALLTNSGVFLSNVGGYSSEYGSSINNYAVFKNADAGSRIINQNGASLNNGGNNMSGWGNSFVTDTASLSNGGGAVLTSTGAYNWTGDTGLPRIIRSSLNNYAAAVNTDAGSQWNNLDGAALNNGGVSYLGTVASANALLTNQNGAEFNNSGAFAWLAAGNYMTLAPSSVTNVAGIVNTGDGSRWLNQNGALIENSGALTNEKGAELTNSGAYVWQDENGLSHVSPSSINNHGGTIANSGSGSHLNNLQGAALNNGSDFGLGWPNAAPTVLANEKGAVLTNSGVYNWQDQAGVQQTTASTLTNNATLINTGAGTALYNQSGGQLVNGMFGALKNQDGALLANGAGGGLSNQGHLQNDSLITNAGTFSSNSVLDGGGSYRQTDGLTWVGGSWTQTLTEIRGGTLAGSGALNGAVLIDGGTLAPSDPNLALSNIVHSGLSINGDLSVSSGLIDIKVTDSSSSFPGSFGFPPFNPIGFPTSDPFGGPILIGGGGGAVSDTIHVSGLTRFSGGVVEIDFLNGYSPALGESLAWLNSAGGIEGWQNLQFRFTGLAGNETLVLNSDGNNLSWTVAAAPVPLPAGGWLFLAGLLGMLRSAVLRRPAVAA